MIVKVECLFCDAKLEGERDYILHGTGLRRDGRRRPKWLIERPEFYWDWNGTDNIIFYLCPKHTDDEHYHKAMTLSNKFRIYKPKEGQ